MFMGLFYFRFIFFNVVSIFFFLTTKAEGETMHGVVELYSVTDLLFNNYCSYYCLWFLFCMYY